MSDIIQINLHRSMLAMVELNRHVKYSYKTDNVRTRADGGVDGPGGGVDVNGERSSIRIHHNVDKDRKKEQNWLNNGDGGVARAPDGHGGGRGSPTREGDERGVGGRGRVRPDGWDHPKPRGRAEIGLFNHKNESSISGVEIEMLCITT